MLERITRVATRQEVSMIIDNIKDYEVTALLGGGLLLYAKRKDIEVFLQPGDDTNGFLKTREGFGGHSENFEALLGGLVEEYMPC